MDEDREFSRRRHQAGVTSRHLRHRSLLNNQREHTVSRRHTRTTRMPEPWRVWPKRCTRSIRVPTVGCRQEPASACRNPTNGFRAVVPTSICHGSSTPTMRPWDVTRCSDPA
uniref:(northern house mosquito) hypothetical protein n=1 Tax=Culex pipiens TaxID=7175 RepID=A0A8D8C7X0_CULPI